MIDYKFENLKNEYYECACGSLEHLLVAVLDKEDNELHFEFHLCQYRNFFKRIWVAIKYIFGYKSRFGCFDTFILRNEDAERLIAMLEKLEK